MKQEKRMTINGLDLIESGEGEQPVIFLHGGPGVTGYMDGLCDLARPKCKVVQYQQRGSRQTDGVIRISDHIDDLRAIVQHYASNCLPILVGHSWGAMLALLFAHSYPEFIEKIILIGCGPLNTEQGDAFQRELARRFGGKRDYFDQLWLKMERGIEDVSIAIEANRYINEIVEYYQNETESATDLQPMHWDFKAAYHSMMESDQLTASNEYERLLSQIRTKVSVIHGTDDLISPESMCGLFKSSLPISQTYTIEKGGHFPWVGHGKESFERTFVQELSD